VTVIKNKHHAETGSGRLRKMLLLMETRSGRQLKALRSDNGGEYVSRSFKAWLTARGVHHQLTVPYSPQQNVAAERINGALLDKVRAVIVSI